MPAPHLHARVSKVGHQGGAGHCVCGVTEQWHRNLHGWPAKEAASKKRQPNANSLCERRGFVMSQLQKEQDQGVMATHILKEGQVHKMLATASAVLKKHLCQPTAVASAKEQPR